MSFAEPTARTGPRPAGALSLAGFRDVWFQPDADDAAARRLSAPRPDLCGLTLDRPRVMGILNVTPDSFSDGGDHAALDAAVDRARVMTDEADIIDIGGESTRPGAEEVPVSEEIRRTAPVIEAIRAAGITTPISIDTRKARVAEAALNAGADIVNDVSAFEFDPELADLCAEREVPVCLMHAKGLPDTMQVNPTYEDVVGEVMGHLEARIGFALSKGVKRERIITDPGIGFGKTLDHNMTLLRHLTVFHDLGLPVLLGVSRKRFIGTIGGADDAKDRLGGSLAVALYGAARGMHILRVHDTHATTQALRLWAAMEERNGRNG
ncbi:dihydropteroate synthase [Maritimibacter sp. DP1N21-5]|uniref:dihydropteroate synthase n=1 Tax=Maritimibacter sp. DP1N21-5 TaxID=2836867 RepID=UPI001C48D265|nr:dihydropteroate synthase [Maritimibacter sp. DP1N21-5]MBV7410765.1 dihydropteroate synthase [Maritimibacter sp. DP1N21-5]